MREMTTTAVPSSLCNFSGEKWNDVINSFPPNPFPKVPLLSSFHFLHFRALAPIIIPQRVRVALLTVDSAKRLKKEAPAVVHFFYSITAAKAKQSFSPLSLEIAPPPPLFLSLVSILQLVTLRHVFLHRGSPKGEEKS